MVCDCVQWRLLVCLWWVYLMHAVSWGDASIVRKQLQEMVDFMMDPKVHYYWRRRLEHAHHPLFLPRALLTPLAVRLRASLRMPLGSPPHLARFLCLRCGTAFRLPTGVRGPNAFSPQLASLAVS